MPARRETKAKAGAQARRRRAARRRARQKMRRYPAQRRVCGGPKEEGKGMWSDGAEVGGRENADCHHATRPSAAWPPRLAFPILSHSSPSSLSFCAATFQSSARLRPPCQAAPPPPLHPLPRRRHPHLPLPPYPTTSLLLLHNHHHHPRCPSPQPAAGYHLLQLEDAHAGVARAGVPLAHAAALAEPAGEPRRRHRQWHLVVKAGRPGLQLQPQPRVRRMGQRARAKNGRMRDRDWKLSKAPQAVLAPVPTTKASTPR